MPITGAIQSGTVTSFSGAGGLLQALLDFIAGTRVTGVSTSGSGSGPYTTAVLTTPVGLGTVIINYTVGAVDFQAIDDGLGNFTDEDGGYIQSASINSYTSSPVVTVTFTTTPDAAPTVDYLYGADGQDWEIKVDRNTRDNNRLSPDEPFGSDCKEVILHNRGFSGSENVLVGIREWKYPAGNAYNWDLTGYTTYTDGMYWGISLEDDMQSVGGYDGTWEHFSQCPGMPLIDDTMYYWFYSNRQRIIVSVKVQSNYESCYLGFANRYGNPEDYPYPLAIIGCSYGNVNYTGTSELSHSFVPAIPSAGSYKLHNVLPDNAWSQNWGSGSSSFATILLPYAHWSNTGVMYECPPKKEVLMTPVIGISILRGYTLWELDGLYHVAGVGVQSEDFIRASDGIKYRAYQNVARTDYDDWMCVAEVDYTTTSTSTTTTTTTTSTTTTTA